MFTCLKRNDKREVKVAQLAGSVGEMSAYHHGEMSLMGTIIGLAQNYVGSNNINLLQPIGQFGTRLAGGKVGNNEIRSRTRRHFRFKRMLPRHDQDL